MLSLASPGTLEWAISKSSLSTDAIRRNRQNAYNRQALICKMVGRMGFNDFAEHGDGIAPDAVKLAKETS